MADEIETMNDQMVGVRGGQVAVVMPKQIMTPDEAMRHAAWLATVAEGLGATHTFEDVLTAIQST